MSATITLNVTSSRMKGKEFAFSEPTRCLVGRSHDCQIQMPDDWEFRDISRHHCELEIDPPLVRVRDLGSLNGTFVNGEKIGQRPELREPNGDIALVSCHEVQPGDEIKIGQVVLKVDDQWAA